MEAEAEEAGDRVEGMEMEAMGGREATIRSWTARFASLEEPLRRSS